MKKGNTLFKNTIYKALLSFVNIVVPLIIGPYIARLLDVELYGIYNKIYSIFQVFFAFASYGVYNLGVRELSKVRNDAKKLNKIFTELFLLSLLTNVILTLIYVLYGLITFKSISLIIYMIFTIQLLGSILYVEFVNEALENYRFITIKSVIVKIIYFISLLLFVTKPTHVVIYSIIVSMTVFVNNFVSFVYAKKRIKFDFTNIKLSKYFKPLFAVVLISNMDLFYTQLDRIMLGSFVSNVSVTMYYIPYYIIATLGAIPYSIINVSVPRLSYIIKNEGLERYQEVLNNSISSLLFIIIPMCFGVFVLAKEIMFLYGGSKYIGAYTTLMVACITKIIISMEAVMNNLVMYPNNKENRIIKVSVTCGIINILFNILLIKFDVFSPITALFTTGISELIMVIIHYMYSKRKMNISIKIFSKDNIKYFLLSCLFIPISFLIRQLRLNFIVNIILIIVFAVLTYLIGLIITKDSKLNFIIDKAFKLLRKNRCKNE